MNRQPNNAQPNNTEQTLTQEQIVNLENLKGIMKGDKITLPSQKKTLTGEQLRRKRIK